MAERATKARGPLQPRLKRAVFAFSGSLLLASCAPVGPDFVPPEGPAPESWESTLEHGIGSGEIQQSDWWRMFQDPVLDALVEDALRHNNSLEIAAMAVLQARATLGIATGSRYPQTQAAAGDATYSSPPRNGLVRSDFWQYSLGASIGWEADFWGRYRRAIESADAAYMASLAAYDQARLLVTSATVKVYAAIRTIEEQLRIARENLNLQQRSYDIAEVLYDQGQDSELDMQQASTLLLATEATIPELESALRQARNALSALLGELPGSVTARLAESSGLPALPQTMAIGVPADLLRRRPDLRQAELVARAQNAQVGLAEAALYPSFSLTGTLGLSAGGPGGGDFGDLFDDDAIGWSAGAGFVWPFFNYGRIRNNVRVEDARLQQALIAYRETAIQAARESEDALAAYDGSVQQIAILEKTVGSARRSNELASTRYAEGYSDYQRVLDAQQALFSTQQRLMGARGDAVQALVDLFQALGAGWRGDDGLPWVNPETLDVMQQRTNWDEGLDAVQATPPRQE